MTSFTFPKAFLFVRRSLFTKQVLFYFAAVALLVVEIIWVVRSFSFLIGKLDAVFLNTEEVPMSLQFDIKGFESLDLIRK